MRKFADALIPDRLVHPQVREDRPPLQDHRHPGVSAPDLDSLRTKIKTIMWRALM
jgi:hypothetical protein